MIFLRRIDYDRWINNRNVKEIFWEEDCPTRLLKSGLGKFLNEKKTHEEFKIFKRNRLPGYPMYSHVLCIMNTKTGKVFACKAGVAERSDTVS